MQLLATGKIHGLTAIIIMRRVECNAGEVASLIF